MEISTDFYIERADEDDEIELQIFGSYRDGEKPYFNAMKGEGHPGSSPEIEFLYAERNKKKFALTETEEIKAQERLEEYIADGGLEDYADDGPPSDRD